MLYRTRELSNDSPRHEEAEESNRAPKVYGDEEVVLTNFRFSRSLLDDIGAAKHALGLPSTAEVDFGDFLRLAESLERNLLKESGTQFLDIRFGQAQLSEQRGSELLPRNIA
jgi:hypothetical protein